MRRKSFNLLNALSLATFVSLTILPLVSTMHTLDGDYDWGFHSLRPLQGLSTCRSRFGDTVRDGWIDCGVSRMAVIN